MNTVRVQMVNDMSKNEGDVDVICSINGRVVRNKTDIDRLKEEIRLRKAKKIKAMQRKKDNENDE